MSKTERNATYEDILALPEHVIGELVDGELIVSPRPAPRHARAAGALFSRLSRWFDDGDGGPGGWWIVFEPEIHLQTDILVPDIGGWRRERMPVWPDTSYFELAPDWVCEIASPSRPRYDQLKKLPKYARHHVKYAWIVDPQEQSLEVYRLSNDLYAVVATYGGDEVVRAEPFDAVELALSLLWLPAPNAPAQQS